MGLERLMRNCETGSLEAWQELARALRRKNIRGDFPDLVFAQVRALEKGRNLNKVEKKRALAQEAYAVFGSGYSLKSRNQKCFHIFEHEHPAFSFCGLSRLGSWDPEWREGGPTKSLCKRCLVGFEKDNPRKDTRSIRELNFLLSQP